MNSQGDSKICVVIRKRPLNKKEMANNQQDIVVVQNQETVIVSEYKQKVDLTKYIEESAFNFDFAFDQRCNNEHIYLQAVRPLIDSAFQGARVTCFAYGQTGSGKTYTMNGDLRQGVAGLYVLGAQDIFGYKNSFSHLKITMSFFEIYCGKLFDLLKNRAELKIREDDKNNVHIIGLNEQVINTPDEFMKIMEFGSNQRRTAQNSTNADSSRSHAILQITLKQGKKIKGKISFIDLAGCERGADTIDQNKQTKIDGAEINKSLLALKECIRALDQGKGHTPFRGSKLTMVLKDSFIGFCRTVMIGNISPNSSSCENTLNTLRYADRVKELKKGGNELLTKEELAAKELMLPRNGKNAVRIMIDKGDDMEDIMNKKIEARQQFGLRQQPTKMMIQEPINRPKNNTFVDKQNIRKIETQDPKTLNKGYTNTNNQVNKNEPGLFDNCKTVEMRPKQGSFAAPIGKIETAHPYVHKNSQKVNDTRTNANNNNTNNFNNEYNYDQNQNMNQNQRQYGSNAGYNNNNSQGYYNQPNNPNINQNQSLFNPQYSSNTPQQNNFTSNQSWSPHQQQQQQSQQHNPQQYHNQNNTQQSQQQQYYNQYHQQQEPEEYNPNPGFKKQTSMNVVPNTYGQNHQDNDRNRRLSYKQQGNNNFQFQQQQPPNFNNQSNVQQIQYQNNNKMSPQQKSTMNQQFEENHTPQRHSIEWINAVQKFRSWNLSVNNQDQIMYFREMHQMLVDKLVQQQDTLSSEHSLTINRQIETIKGEMKFIQQMEKNKANHESIQYVEFIEDMIDRKLSVLVKLKKRVNQFKEHLIEHQECQQKIFMAQEQMAVQDELLLDDEENY